MDFIVNLEDGTEEPFYLTENPEMQAPILGWAKRKAIPYLLLIPDDRSLSTLWVRDLRKLVPKTECFWTKKENKAFWRGGQTELVHRIRLCQLSLENPDLLDAGLSSLWLNISSEFDPYMKAPASYEEHMKYKYLPIINGVMCTYPGYQWRLFSGSLSMKQESDQIQWFYRELKPYIHYVPIATDLSDLFEKIKWAKNNDTLCATIAKNAREFALKHLLFDDIYQYLYLALCHYADHLDPQETTKLEQTNKDPNWVLIERPKYKPRRFFLF
jgi:hypothetical protein